MKFKNFDDYLKKRLNFEEIAEIERQAGISFNKLVRRLDVSPRQVAEIQTRPSSSTDH